MALRNLRSLSDGSGGQSGQHYGNRYQSIGEHPMQSSGYQERATAERLRWNSETSSGMAKPSGKKRAASRGVSAGPAGKAEHSSSASSWWTRWFTRDWFRGLILALAVAVVYQPVWYAGFIWDDDDHLTANPTIIGPLGFKDIWTTSYADIAPLTRSTFWLEHKLWGLAPLPYHLVNVLLHAACAILLWRILLKLRVPGAWLGAALWALHPVEVESVAWITEMKNTESGLFFLLSIFFFVEGLGKRDSERQSGRDWNYALTLLFAALAMASKSSTVVLPAVLCLCAWWLKGRWQWRGMASVIPATVIPVSLMSIVASAISIWAQRLQLANVEASQYVRTWPQRLTGAGDAVWFYLGKLLWPHPLVTVYPRREFAVSRWYSYLPLLAVVLVLLIFWFKRRSWARAWFFALAWFLIALLPVLGFFDNSIFRLSLVFDHFQYLASMGPLALAGAGLVWLGRRAATRFATATRWPVQPLAGTAVLVILGLVSWQRVWAYESQTTLWTDTVAKNPDCWAGYYTLGDVFSRQGQTDEAIAYFRTALAINPNYVQAHNNLGMALSRTGRVDEAIVHFRKALEIDPGYAAAYNNLGNTLGSGGRLDEAIEQYQMALKINPNYAEAHNGLGTVLARQGHLDEAIAQYNTALQINARYADAHYNIGDILLHNRRPGEAVVQFEKALEIQPDHPDAYNDLGLALAQEGRIDEAIARFQDALRLNPSHAGARENLARAEAMVRASGASQ
jgi:protein O-mannosyl-transferase